MNIQRDIALTLRYITIIIISQNFVTQKQITGTAGPALFKGNCFNACTYICYLLLKFTLYYFLFLKLISSSYNQLYEQVAPNITNL